MERAAFLESRRRDWELLRDVAQRIQPGMSEAEGYELLLAGMRRHGGEPPPYPPVIRFGADTQRPCSPHPDPHFRLEEDDIFILDFGHVGDTFVLGRDSEMRRCVRDCRMLFELVREEWRGTKHCGPALYDYAEKAAQSRGWLLVREQKGRGFPHATKFPDAWALEIHIRHPGRPFGAFYEDILLG